MIKLINLYDKGKISLLKSAQFGLSAPLSTISMKSSLMEKLQVWPVTEVIECLEEREQIISKSLQGTRQDTPG